MVSKQKKQNMVSEAAGALPAAQCDFPTSEWRQRWLIMIGESCALTWSSFTHYLGSHGCTVNLTKLAS
jgi:hypothetical protein